MGLVIYPLIVTREFDRGFMGEFPDLPGAGVGGADAASLLGRARESLLSALRALEACGDAWPRPTPLDSLEGHGMVVLVDVQVEDTPVRVNISIGERLLSRLDAAAAGHGMTRSGFIAAAVRRRLDDEPRRAVDDDAVERLRREVANIGRRVNETLGPDSEIGRTIAELDDAATDGLRRLSRNLTSALRPRRTPPPAQAHAEEEEAEPPPPASDADTAHHAH